MKNIFFVTFMLFAFVLVSAQNKDKHFVYAEFETSYKGSLKNYYYYGEINHKVYDKIQKGEFVGNIIALDNVHYVDNDDKLIAFEDEDDTGTIFFSTDDLILIIEKSSLPNQKAK